MHIHLQKLMGTGSVAAGVYVRPFGSHANQSSPGVDSKLCSPESNRACIGRPFESLQKVSSPERLNLGLNHLMDLNLYVSEERISHGRSIETITKLRSLLAFVLVFNCICSVAS